MTRVRLTILCLSILLVFLVGSASADSRFYYVDGDDPDTNVYVDIALGLMGGSTFGYLDLDNGTFTEITDLSDVQYNDGDIINYAVQKTMGGGGTVTTTVDLLSFNNLVTYSDPVAFGETIIYQTAEIDWGIGFGTTTFNIDLPSDDGMKAIPIPASVLLLGSGVLGLIVIGRVRKTKQ